MLIDEAAGWAILTPPKTGSTSLRHHFSDRYSGKQHDMELPDKFRGHVYVTVRNPFARAVSLWQHRLWDRSREAGLRGPHQLVDRLEFADFIEELPQLDNFFYPMSWWIRDLPEPYGLLRLESLEPSLRRIGLLMADQELPQLNKTKHEPASTYYADDYLRWRIIQHFAADFEQFRYSTNITRDAVLV